jgi:hypothetical protein
LHFEASETIRSLPFVLMQAVIASASVLVLETVAAATPPATATASAAAAVSNTGTRMSMLLSYREHPVVSPRRTAH